MYILIIILIINIIYIFIKYNLKDEVVKNIKLNSNPTFDDINYRLDDVIYDKDNYVRELDFINNINYIYWLATTYDLIDKKMNIIGAYFIKWFHEKRITISNSDNNKLIKENYVIIELHDIGPIENELEQELFNLIKTASGNNLLDKEEFTRWLSSNLNILKDWFDKLYISQTEKLKNINKIVSSDYGYVVSDEIINDVQNLNGLKNYLIDFGRIDEKELKHVEFYQYYLVVAGLFGLNEIIKSELGNIYPDYLIDIDSITNKINELTNGQKYNKI